jgi:glucose/mannose transport system substrate-binding protein
VDLGGEAAALNVLKDDLGTKSIGWVDMPVAGGGGEAAMTTLRARVTAGEPAHCGADAGLRHPRLGGGGRAWRPDAGGVGRGLGCRGAAALQGFSKYDGKWISAPVNVHSTNWVWISKAALDATGKDAPASWEELVAVLDAMKANGITPLAHGGQAWQDATVFDGVVLSLGRTSTRPPSSTSIPRRWAARRWPRRSTG